MKDATYRFTRVGRMALAAAIAFGAAACNDTGALTAPVAQADAATAPDGQQLARAFALALRSPEQRIALRDALRDAPYNEHKLVLQEFAATARGQALVDAAAQAAGVEPAQVRAWIATLPQMDLYVPLPQQRRSWQATDDLVVGLNLSVNDTKLTGFDPAGGSHALDARQGVPTRTVVLMAPAEPKVRRADAGARPSRTDVIEPDAVDGPAVTVVGGGPRLSISATYTGAVLYAFHNYLPDGWGGIELMVKTYNTKGGTRLDEEIMGEGGGCGAGIPGCYPDWSYPERQITMGTWIKVWERDSGFPESGGDDFWGEMAFYGYGSTKVHTFWTGCTVAGADSSQYCASWDPNWIFYQTPSVDIVFNHATNGAYDIY